MSHPVRLATLKDAPLIAAMVRELAEYEKLAHEATASESDLVAALFGAHPRAFCEIAEVDGAPAGFSLWFYSFSTFVGRHGIHLEDLFVRPAFRKRGVGRLLVGRLAQRCVAERLGRLEWSVLKWNAPAIAFYESLGAVAMDGWTVYRTTGAALARLGDHSTLRAGRRVGDEDGTK